MATLNRIANEKYKQKVSHKTGFSLNGGIRNNSYVGQTSLARKVNKTYFTRYHGPSGNGGNLGSYLIRYTKQSSCCSNNPKIIKKSVLNTKGMIKNKYKWLHSSYPNIVVQPDSNFPLNSSSGLHTESVSNNMISKGMEKVGHSGPCVISKETININDKSSQVRLNNLSKCFSISIYPPKLNNSGCHSIKK